ncbi:hypothetical protein BOTBODRAFT_26275 [Botryobasidium botryosum FD-172 SS1]|uniref:Zn(2)-C6 fungal-type domain-containing protein n=1 Tax=Botryobasidium botryosum (strain FD-172 SS1) TaxID=930990 RepID=A0A067N1K9_BOTB1|nr:hypothetical protein BOTBODRAFT_26275 [Botryobasidium botryosum FD-172 SS1]
MEGTLEIALVGNEPSPSKPKRIKKGTACTACREKKRRCDARKPTCTSCIDDGEPECIYTVMKLKPRTVILQQRISRLEAQVDSLQASINLSAALGFMLPSQSAMQALQNEVSQSVGFGLQREYSSQVQLHLHGKIGPMLGSWWATGQHPPSGLITIITRSFAQREHHHTHDLLPLEFYASLQDPDPETGPHFALRNVIFLMGCAYDPGPLNVLEPVFLRRARYYLDESLARADRLSDYVEAYTLLGTYYLFKGRYVQGVGNGAATIMIAVACGLHGLSPPSWCTSRTPSLLPPPCSRTEIQRRIRIWWMIFTMNRIANAAAEIPGDFSDENIETLWELPPESDDLAEIQLSTVSSLCADGSKSTFVYNDTANVLRSKCAALLERARNIGAIAAQMTSDQTTYWQTFRATNKAIELVTRSLPSAYEEPRFEPDARHIAARASGKINHFSIIPHHFVCGAMVFLHYKRARAGNLASRDACLKAAWRMMPIVRQILVQKMGSSVFSYCAFLWMRVFQEFAHEYERLHALGDQKSAKVILPELKVLALALKEQATSFFLASALLADLRTQFPSLHKEHGII